VPWKRAAQRAKGAQRVAKREEVALALQNKIGVIMDYAKSHRYHILKEVAFRTRRLGIIILKPAGIIYLNNTAGIQFKHSNLFNSHSNKPVGGHYLFKLSMGFPVSQLLFVIRKGIFHNYNVYNRLNYTIKRTRIDVEELS